ncbi:MAG: hypothetical protein ACI306_04270 [Muribaculaceae bacterium]
MLGYLKYMFQLLLMPSRGWEDISAESPVPEAMQSRGYYPLLALTAAAVFMQLLYDSELALSQVIQTVLAFLCSYFASIYVAHIALELWLPKYVDGELNMHKCSTLVVMTMGLMVVIRCVCYMLPSQLTPVKFLPLLVVVVLHRAAAYMCVKSDSVISYLLASAAVIVVMPLVLYYIMCLLLVG